MLFHGHTLPVATIGARLPFLPTALEGTIEFETQQRMQSE